MGIRVPPIYGLFWTGCLICRVTYTFNSIFCKTVAHAWWLGGVIEDPKIKHFHVV